jgi:hypothetical protein
LLTFYSVSPSKGFNESVTFEVDSLIQDSPSKGFTSLSPSPIVSRELLIQDSPKDKIEENYIFVK